MAGRMNESVSRVAGMIFFLIVAFCCACAGSKEAGESRESSRPIRAPEGEPADATRDDRPLIVAFGDSLTAGLGVGPEENYPAKLQARIDAGGYR